MVHLMVDLMVDLMDDLLADMLVDSMVELLVEQTVEMMEVQSVEMMGKWSVDWKAEKKGHPMDEAWADSMDKWMVVVMVSLRAVTLVLSTVVQSVELKDE